MSEASAQRHIRIHRTRSEVEALREFWNSCHPRRDADLDFFLFTVDLFPEAERPHVVVLYEEDAPKALLAARLETGRVSVKLGYFSLPVPRLRILQIVHGGWLGDLSEANAKLLIGSVLDSLANGEADAASLHGVGLDSPLARFVNILPHRWCADRRINAQARHMRELSGPDGSRLASPSRNEQYKQRQRERGLAREFGECRIEQFTKPADVDRLAQDAEIIAAKSYQRGLGVGFAATPIVRSRLQFEAGKGWLRGYVLYLEGRPCAFWIGSLRNQVFLSDFLSFDTAYAKFSPGMYLILKVIEELQKETSGLPVRLVDFGIGDASYEERLANRSSQEGTLYVFAPRLRALWVNALRTSVHIINKTAKRLLQRNRWLAEIKRRWRSRLSHVEANT